MKKTSITTVMLFIALLSIGQADSRIREGITVEPFVAYSQSSFIGSDAPESTALETFAFGINANYHLDDTWSVQAGIIKDEMGGALFAGRITRPDQGITFTSRILSQEFITIPLLANWHFGKRKRWNLAFGGAYSIAIGEVITLNDQTNSSFGSVAMTVGYQIPLPTGHLKISSPALFKVVSNKNQTVFDHQSRNLVSLGYQYHFR